MRSLPVATTLSKMAAPGGALTLHVDAEGKARYDAIVQQGRRDGQHVQSQFKDLIPLSEREESKDQKRSLDRPSEEEVSATADRTRQALEQIVHGKIKAAQPKNVPNSSGSTSYLRYTPASQGQDGKKQRIIKTVSYTHLTLPTNREV